MRPSNKSRSRNKNNNQRRNVGNVVNRVFDSAGPDGKVRGTPQQIIDKYNVLARDAQLSGDRVIAENYLQHAEHYNRMLGEAQRQQQEQREAQEQQRAAAQQRNDNGRDDGAQRDNAANGNGNGERRRNEARGNDVAPGFGLTTIDPDDSDTQSGPVETPEQSGDLSAAKGSEPASGDDNQDQPPAQKRPRTRRKAAEAEDAEKPRKTRTRRKADEAGDTAAAVE